MRIRSDLERVQPRATELGVLAVVDQGKHLINGYDVSTELRRQLAEVRSAIGRSLDEAHALIDGKWLVDVVAPESTSLSPQRCREVWIDHALSVGGLPEVVELWERIRKR